MHHAEKLLIDPAVASGLLEEAAATVSRAIATKSRRAQNEVRDLPAYLFRAFIRRVNRSKRQQLNQETAVRSLELGSVGSIDPLADLDMKIFVDELLTRSDPVTRDMFYRRVQGFSWKEIAASYGISHDAARTRFKKALRKLGAQPGLETDL
jgi:DNA-directed RNA polymerase specialized sigma24 family protein